MILPFQQLQAGIRFTILILFPLGFLNLSIAEAQTPIVFHLSSGYAECAVFNPLSKGRIMYSVGQDTFKRSDDAGRSWLARKLNVNPNYGFLHQALCLAIDTNVLFVVDQKEILRSSDGGNEWSVVLDSGSFDGETLDYHAEDTTLYFGSSLLGPFYKSKDLGVTWQQQSATASHIALCTVSVSPTTEATVLSGGGDGSIARSTDEGVHWDTVYPSYSDIFHAEVPKIVYSSWAPQTAFAAVWYSTHASMLRTTNDGISWTPLPAAKYYPWALEVDQRASTIVGGVPQHLWLGLIALVPIKGSQYLQESNDGGETWKGIVIDSLEIDTPRDIETLKFDTTSATLLIAGAQGVFKMNYAESISHISAQTHALVISQNPLQDHTTIQWSQVTRMKQVSMTDILGREHVYNPSAGIHQIELTKRELSPGLWIVRGISSTGEVAGAKLLVE
jgi:photosystem II stability/assembly factor-like uncharacterized protein